MEIKRRVELGVGNVSERGRQNKRHEKSSQLIKSFSPAKTRSRPYHVSNATKLMMQGRNVTRPMSADVIEMKRGSLPD